MTYRYVDVPDFTAFTDGPPTRKRKWEEDEPTVGTPTSGLPGVTPSTPPSITPATPTTPTTPGSGANLMAAPGGSLLHNDEDEGDEEDEGKDETPSEVRIGDVAGI